MAIGGGDKGKVASISVGWMVNPSLYQNDHVHLYASWIAPWKKTGCYDITCPGFVQVSKNVPLGALLQPSRKQLTNIEQYHLNTKRKNLRELKAINKPAIKSFRTKQGALFDCIDIHKQLAFDHHLLKNHSVQFAVVDYGPNSFSEVKGVFNLWDPQVSQDQLSLAYMAVGGGAGRKFASISVSWMVNPSLYQDNNAQVYHLAFANIFQFLRESVLYVLSYWAKRHRGQTGCYDIRCPGFVQVSKMIPLGALLQPVSVYNGKQCELQLSLYQDRAKGDWWFTYGNENIGYWPASLLVASNLANRENYGSWRGQAYSPETEKTPAMGSGHWPRERLNKAAYVNSIKIINGKGKVLDPESDIMKTRSTNPKYYMFMRNKSRG
ncbi:unnamed protein product [Arabis nemorensis]|uniref:Neprosin PEP catalytic domain-containing protein n=1 Tax=Arabis nemorensis TaxID=586526 RepID=A0A565C9H8_9BRAS|nr:unnamed protein product [Arabis nemorensis]